MRDELDHPNALPNGYRLQWYEIDSVLGQGGFGITYVAHDINLNLKVAIKEFMPADRVIRTQDSSVLPMSGGDYKETFDLGLRRFLAEARMLAQLRHPNIVQVHSVFQENNTAYMVMDYVEGQTLAKAVPGIDTFTEALLLSIVYPLLDCLHTIHQEGFIHRDIKPDNILLREDGTPVLLDFGSARHALGPKSRSLTNLVTPGYAPFEQYSADDKQGPWTDIFSLSATLYRIISGTLPIDVMVRAGAILNGGEDPLVPAQKVGQERYSERFLIAIDRALAFRPADRPQSVAEWRHMFPELTGTQTGSEDWTHELNSASSRVEPPSEVLTTETLARMSKEISSGGSPTDWPSDVTFSKSDGVPTRPIFSCVIVVMLTVLIVVMLTFLSLWSAPYDAIKYVSFAIAIAALLCLVVLRIRRASRRGGAEIPLADRKIHPKNDVIDSSIKPERQRSDSSREPVIKLPTGEPPPTPDPSSDLIPDDDDLDRTVLVAAPSKTELGTMRHDNGLRNSTRMVEIQPSTSTGRFKVSLVITQCPERSFAGRKIPLTTFPFKIGRAPEADLHITVDHSLSRIHAMLDYKNNRFMLTDASSNGTFVNGRYVGRDTQNLLFGDTIRMGDTILTFISDEIEELPDMTGVVLDRRYRLTSRLRSGFKADWYTADMENLPQRLAIKILSPKLIAYPGYREQFNQEAKIAAGLRHPHICKVIDFGETTIVLDQETIDNVLYLCLDLLEGGSLADRLADGESIAIENLTEWVRKLSDALDYVHRQGIVHSGIKPTSVVFDDEDNPYLTDFAFSMTGGKDGNAIIGAPEFLAPEQWEGKLPTPAVDQYSFAVLIYFLLSGSRPYVGQELPDIRARNFTQGPIPVHEEAARNKRSHVPASLSNVLERAMSTASESRFQSIKEFAQSFEYAATGGIRAEGGEARVFISYWRDASAGWAVLFARELEKNHGISVFFDTQRLDSAGRFPARIQRAIETCDVFVCLLADGTLGSKWVNHEIELALQNRKPMVPVFQESYVEPDFEGGPAGHVEALLAYDGVHLLDRRNIHVDHTISDLAEIITQTVNPPISGH